MGYGYHTRETRDLAYRITRLKNTKIYYMRQYRNTDLKLKVLENKLSNIKEEKNII
ncbi:unnamed protein product [marine sediment metagenome]|uniref:Uncharacterized protein n=1 Tax=marine sediment metagenome TaxID=412755 RepID=X1DM03_9ZZZZ